MECIQNFHDKYIFYKKYFFKYKSEFLDFLDGKITMKEMLKK